MPEYNDWYSLSSLIRGAEVMTLPDDIELREELEIRLCINGCQQRTAGYNEAKQGKKGLDTDDMERMETIAVNEAMKLIATYRTKWETEARVDELEALSSPKFLRNIRTTITDSNGEVYTDDSHMYISKFEVQERILELKEKTND